MQLKEGTIVVHNMKFIFYLFILLLYACNGKTDYNLTIQNLSKIVEEHKGISIGKRGDIRTIAIKTNDKTIYKDLNYDTIGKNYLIKDFVGQELEQSLKSIGISKVELEDKINKIIEVNNSNKIVASNCIEDENCYKCIFWLTAREHLILLKDENKICNYYLGKEKRINSHWIYLKE